MACAQKKAEAEGRTILFVDESGFSLLPAVARTFAPQGRTPVLKEVWTRDHLSVISGITPEGRLYVRVHEVPLQSRAVVEFLTQVHHHVQGKLLVVWDGAPIHRSKVVQGFLAEGAAEWLQLERLPAYAPELNPDEGVWHHLKGVELKNVVCQTMSQLRSELRKATERLRHKRRVLRACYARSGLLAV